MVGFEMGKKPDGLETGHPMILLFELFVDVTREAGNVTGSSVLLKYPVGLALIQNVHDFLQFQGRFLRGFSREDGLHGRADFVFFSGITRRAGFGAADILDRRLDDRHGTSKEFINSFLKRRHIVNEGEDRVNKGSITRI